MRSMLILSFISLPPSLYMIQQNSMFCSVHCKQQQKIVKQSFCNMHLLTTMAPVGHLHVGLKNTAQYGITEFETHNYTISELRKQNSACQTQTAQRLDFFDFVGKTSDSTLTDSTTYFQKMKFTLINWENVLSLSVLHSELK